MAQVFLQKDNDIYNKLPNAITDKEQFSYFFNMACECYKDSIRKVKQGETNIEVPGSFSNQVENTEINTNFMKQYKTNSAAYSLAFAAELNLKCIGLITSSTSFNNLSRPDTGRNTWNQLYGIGAGGSGHNLPALLYNLNDHELIDLIKYETILAPAKTDFLMDELPSENFIKAPEIMSVLKEVNMNDFVKNNDKKIYDNKSAFQDGRYFEKIFVSNDLIYLISLVQATHIILCDVIKRKTYSPTAEDTTKINEITHNHPELNYLDDYQKKIISEKFSLEEIRGISNEYNNGPKDRTLIQYFNYFIFIKDYIKNGILEYDEKTIPNVINLFKTISQTHDISDFGNTFVKWFNSIEKNRLSIDEFNILNNIDPAYIYNSLNISDKILYKKCVKYDISFYSAEVEDFCYEDIKERIKISRNFNIPLWKVNNIKKIYDGLSEIDFNKILEESKDTQTSKSSVKESSEDLREEQYKEYDELYKKIGTSFENIIYLVQELGIDKLKELIEIADKDNLVRYDIIKKYIADKDWFEKALNIATKENFNFVDVLYHYKEENFKEFGKIAKDTQTYYWLVKEYYSEINDKDKFKELFKYSKDKSISFDIIVDIYRRSPNNYNKILNNIEKSRFYSLYGYGTVDELIDVFEKLDKLVNLSTLKETLNNIEINENMSLLSTIEILKNISLVGSVGNYILYKTPDEIVQIQELCANNNINFQNAYLYFDIDYLNDNIVNISSILNKQIKFETDNDVEFFVKRVKEIVDADKYKKQGETMLNYLEHINSAVPSFIFNKSKNNKEKQVK